MAVEDEIPNTGEFLEIMPGKDADIIAVAGSPLEDVTRMEKVDFVMRHGVVHKAAGKRQGFPAD